MTSSKGDLSPHSERERLILYHVAAHLAAGVSDHEQIVSDWARRWGGVSVPRTETTVDVRQWEQGVVGFHVRLTSATDWDKLARLGWIKPEFAKYRNGFRDAERVRPRWPDPARVIAAVAAFYLSRAGGGDRDRQAAWDLLCDSVPAVSAEAISEYHKLIATIRREFGPLTADELSQEKSA